MQKLQKPLGIKKLPQSSLFNKSETLIKQLKQTENCLINDVTLSYYPSAKLFRSIKLEKDFQLPEAGQAIHIRTQKQFNQLLYLVKIIDRFKVVNELIIATYTVSAESLEMLLDFYQRKIIKSLSFILSNTYDFRFPELYKIFKEKALDLDFNLIFMHSHLKIALFQATDQIANVDHYFHIEGSMNWSLNNLTEQILISNNKELYDFDRNFLYNDHYNVMKNYQKTEVVNWKIK